MFNAIKIEVNEVNPFDTRLRKVAYVNLIFVKHILLTWLN